MKFKTARELKITAGERNALIAVLDKLETRKIPAKLFDMGTSGAPECGVPGCIRGWARTIVPHGFEGLSDKNPTFALFYPSAKKGCDPYSAKRNHAANALRRFLRTGKPNWHLAMRAA
jgi:hypothetical protein